ncbi:hypothetical protein OG468_39035 [Streptomyces zaomyceticus]|uniref:hypothetical protein n=1 Tax=Streptomyces zaomyceticus TaxID=68286 RepID=UPI00324C31B1
MLIKGYDDGPLVAGEPLMTRPGFWSNHLMGMCDDGAGHPVPEWFGDDGADADALSEVLFDPGHWPVFRVPAAEGPGVVVVYRNQPGDYGIDYLLTPPGRSSTEQLTGWEGDLAENGLTWHELVRIADTPVHEAEGAADPAARLLLVLPLLNDLDLPAAAPARLGAALAAAGSPQDTVTHTAESLLAHLMGRSRHDADWASPLSGGY